MGMGLQFTRVERSELPILEQWIGELDGTAPQRADSCEQAGEIETEMPIDRKQWYVLHEMVIGLMRKTVVGHEEGKAMLQKLLQESSGAR